ncbi:MAG: hypothetical protein HZC16_00290 [Candidatus Omnitrophica bacterium]|nr:hypothetical protein [Candidatus Omnitrophota bacterium]
MDKPGRFSLNAIVSTYAADIKNHSALAAGSAERRIEKIITGAQGKGNIA